MATTVKTTLQTVEIVYSWSTKIFTSIEPVPVPPEGVEKYVGVEDEIWVKSSDGTETVWKKDRYVGQNLPDGTIKTWWIKPTYKDAYELGKKFWKSSFQFHKDGQVSCTICQINYVWLTNTVEVERIKGEEHKWVEAFTNERGEYMELVPISSTYYYDSDDDSYYYRRRRYSYGDIY